LSILKDGKHAKQARIIIEEILIWNMVDEPLDKSLIFHIVPWTWIEKHYFIFCAHKYCKNAMNSHIINFQK
jgi:hypothetical protein